MENENALLYDMPMQSYLDLYGYLGGSMLSLVLTNPQSFDHIYNKRNTSFDSEATKIGSLTHTLFMEPHKVDEEYHLIPQKYVNKDGKLIDWKENENYSHVKDDIEVAGRKKRVTFKQLQTAQNYADKLSQSCAAEAIERSVIEPTFLCELDNGIKLKARPDMMEKERDICYNVKTARSADPNDFFREAIKFGYDISAALTAYCYESAFGRELEDYVFIVVEKKEPYPVEIFSSNKPMYGEGSLTFMQFGALRLKKALGKYTECIKNNYWPSYENDGIMRIPYYNIREYLNND